MIRGGVDQKQSLIEIYADNIGRDINTRHRMKSHKSIIGSIHLATGFLLLSVIFDLKLYSSDLFLNRLY